MPKVRLLAPRSVFISRQQGYRSEKMGDVVDVSDQSAANMISLMQAELVEGEEVDLGRIEIEDDEDDDDPETKTIEFAFDGGFYHAPYSFYETNEFTLPNGLVVAAESWTETDPPTPVNLHLVEIDDNSLQTSLEVLVTDHGLDLDSLEKLQIEDANNIVPVFGSVEELDDWITGGGALADKKGLGSVTQKKVETAVDAWKAATDESPGSDG